MENYIVINGRKAELTEEQLKALGIEVNSYVFNRVDEGHHYYRITAGSEIECEEELGSHLDNRFYNVANYCTDAKLLQQQAYREILNRLLWRYSMEHDGDKIDWDNKQQTKYCIYYDHNEKRFYTTDYHYIQNYTMVHFHTRITAQNAIKEIIEPFMVEHPYFKW